MTQETTPQPTPAELAILQTLWRLGPSTVRDVHAALQDDRETAYTTTLKMLQIMTEKGLVSRQEDGRAHIYTAKQSEEQAHRRIVGDLLDRVFEGAAQKLVMHALESGRASAEELAEIRRLLDELEGGRR